MKVKKGDKLRLKSLLAMPFDDNETDLPEYGYINNGNRLYVTYEMIDFINNHKRQEVTVKHIISRHTATKEIWFDIEEFDYTWSSLMVDERNIELHGINKSIFK